METRHSFQILSRVQIKRLLVLIISIVGVLVVLSQVITLRYTNYTSILSPVTNNNIMDHEVTIYDINASSTYEGTLNNLKVEVGFKGYDLDARNVSNPNLLGLTVPVSSELTQLSYMISLLESAVAASSRKSKLLSARDRELQHVRMQIENAPTVRSTGGLHASLYRNVSKFLRSYKLMENTFKVYVYKDGKKPIFHDPKLRGIYASEGWFMKLIEKNRNFITKDPQKAHLFYLPFSSLRLCSRVLIWREKKEFGRKLKKKVCSPVFFRQKMKEGEGKLLKIFPPNNPPNLERFGGKEAHSSPLEHILDLLSFLFLPTKEHQN